MQVDFGWSAALGSGLVVVRTDDGGWSPPLALDMVSLSWGLQAGGALHDLLIVLRNRQVKQQDSQHSPYAIQIDSHMQTPCM